MRRDEEGRRGAAVHRSAGQDRTGPGGGSGQLLPVGLLVDANLFLSEAWFEEAKKKEWKQLHIPAGREFKTKIDLAKERFQRAMERVLDFRGVGCDSIYGSDASFRRMVGRQAMAEARAERYLAERTIKTASLNWALTNSKH